MNKYLSILLTLSLTHITYAEKIAVVGAGLSGLTAAYRLAQEGHNVQVYEALPRPGGRVFTCYFEDGYCELGGMNILDGGDGSHVRALAKELNVELVSYLFDYDLAHCLNESQALTSWRTFISAAPKPTTDIKNILMQSHNLKEVINLLIGESDPILKRFLKIRTCCWEGNDCKDLSMAYFDCLWEFYETLYDHGVKNERMTTVFCTVKNGMCNLIKALINTLPRAVHYRMPLTRISSNLLGKLTLHFNEQEISADKVVLSLPCTTLRDITIDAGIIPQDQQHMIDTLQYGTNATILIPTTGVRKRKWGFNDSFLMLDFSPVLWLYFGGRSGIFDATNSESLTAFFATYIPSVNALYPKLNFDTQVKPVPASSEPFIRINYPVAISWVHEPYAKGSYSCLAPGQEVLYEQYTDYRGEKIRTVFRPIKDTIFFAGEHTAQEPATMEGAVESGERAARMVLSSLKFDLLKPLSS